MTGQSIFGLSCNQFSLAVANGFCSYLLSSPIVNTLDVGTAGVGAGSGLGIIIPPPIFINAFQSTFAGKGINGEMRSSLIRALAFSLSASLAFAQIITAHAGTGVGTGTIVNITPVPTMSISLMIQNFIGSGLLGVMSANLATAIAQGIDQALPSAKGQIIIVGPSSPFPGGGLGSGRIL
jgi:hypothetical protein